MRYWHGRRGLLHCTVVLVLVGSCALGGCTQGGSGTATINGTLRLTATNAAALGGLTFAFADGTVFGFAGQPTTLTFGPDGTTFTLTPSGNPPITGTLTFGSCTFTQNPAPLGPVTTPLVQAYDTCQVTGKSASALAFGGSGTGTLTLTLGNASLAPVTSDPLDVTYTIDTNGNIFINTNTTPIGVVG
jgi:hypothetical protein